MRKKIKSCIAIFTTTAVLLTGCSSSQGIKSSTDTSESAASASTSESIAITTATSSSQIVVDTEFSSKDLEVGYDESTAVQVTLNGSDISVSGDGAAAEDGVLTISQEGTYVLTGTLNDGQILVDADDSEKVRIILNGVTITNQDNAAIYIKSADKVFITLEDGTENTLTDGSEYVQADDNNVDGVIYSKADLTINGSGTLDITGNYKHGIVSKDDLVITGGIINVTAVKDALNGKDAVKIKDGTITLAAENGNGIQSKNDDDETKGYVYIAGGEITVTNSQEGIEGTVIQIDDGTIDIMAQDDGLNASSGTSDTTDDSSTDEETASTSGTTSSSTAAARQTTAETTALAASDSVSTIQNNVIKVAASDSTTSDTTDATSNATTNDFSQQSTGDQAFAGGGGNGGGGNFDGGNGGGGEFENDTNCLILINGGTLTVNASGDGIDSNGSLNITGGTVYVSGPTNGGDGALDYNGTADITGGIAVIVGSVGMAQSFSESSTQYSILYNLSNVSEAGEEVALTDEDGNVIVSYTPDKQYQSVVISSPELALNETYTLTSGDQTAEITITSIVTSNATGGIGGGGGGFQGGGPGMNGQNAGPGDASTTDSTQTAEES